MASSTGYLLLFVFALSFTAFMIHEKVQRAQCSILKCLKTECFLQAI